ncbi:MAG: Betaine-aldehyde dehydrogenase [Marmoricola sp.]|nr:Betaine-aldehyde dehydrogenase [Marmoricola sp.]
MKYQTTIETAGTDVPDWHMFVDGEWVGGADDTWADVVCPSRDNTVIARVPAGGPQDVDRAVAAARSAQPAWRALHFTVRQKALLGIADAIEAEAEALASLTAQDTGNALRTQARPEVNTLIALFRYFAGVAGEFKGTVLPAGDDQLQYTRLEPLGVVGAILPWNSPLMIAAMKIPAALVAGNTVVVKPAEDGPLTVLRLAEVAAPFLPAGVLNVVTGDGAVVGEAIVGHPGIDKVSFTGSSAVGRRVGEIAGSRLAHASLELGGKSPCIVFPSAATEDRIKDTAAGVLLGMRFTRQGQSCTAGSRLFVHRDVYEPFLAELATQVGALQVGDPLAEETDMGTIINRKQFESVCAYVDEGKQQEGVRIVLDGGPSQVAGGGYYLAPTILADVSNDWRIAREEVFGPVLVVIPWDDVDEVVAMANDSHYGLAAFVWSQNLTEALDTAHRIESGWVQVNQGGGQAVGQSYGGYKQSGIGREFSIEGAIAGFTQTKQINVRL